MLLPSPEWSRDFSVVNVYMLCFSNVKGKVPIKYENMGEALIDRGIKNRQQRCLHRRQVILILRECHDSTVYLNLLQHKYKVFWNLINLHILSLDLLDHLSSLPSSRSNITGLFSVWTPAQGNAMRWFQGIHIIANSVQGHTYPKLLIFYSQPHSRRSCAGPVTKHFRLRLK